MPPTAHHLPAAPRTRGDVPLTALLGRLSRRRGAEYSISPPSRPADDWGSPVSSRWRAPGGIATGLLASRPAPTLRPPWTTPATAGYASGRTRTRLRSRLSQEPCRRVPKEPGRPAPARMSMPFEPGTASAQCAVVETFPELRASPARLVRLDDHRGTQGGKLPETSARPLPSLADALAHLRTDTVPLTGRTGHLSNTRATVCRHAHRVHSPAPPRSPFSRRVSGRRGGLPTRNHAEPAPIPEAVASTQPAHHPSFFSTGHGSSGSRGDVRPPTTRKLGADLGLRTGAERR